MLDRVGVAVRDSQRSEAFYEKALAPLGLTLPIEPVGEAAGFGGGSAGCPPDDWLEVPRATRVAGADCASSAYACSGMGTVWIRAIFQSPSWRRKTIVVGAEMFCSFPSIV
jgi:hypothetical protein